jgi:hypothetical protein
MSRYFTLESSSIGITGGRYKSEKPSLAAKKIAEKLFQNSKKKVISLCIRETTKNSKKKSYHYKAKKTKDSKSNKTKTKDIVSYKIIVETYQPLYRKNKGGSIDEQHQIYENYNKPFMKIYKDMSFNLITNFDYNLIYIIFFSNSFYVSIKG